MDDGQWWVLRDGITLGPYGLEELRQYATRGKLYADDLVSTAGEKEWTPAGAASALLDLFPKDGSEDATVALGPSLRAMSAPPVPARRSQPSASPLRATTLPPRPPTTSPTAVEQPSKPREAPVVPTATATAPAARWGVGMGLVIGLVAASSALVIERLVDGGRHGAPPREASATPAAPATTPPRTDASAPVPESTPRVGAVAGEGPGAHDAGQRGVPGGARAECLGPAAIAGVGRTLEMLRAMEGLMTGAAPPADTFDYAALATACLTSVARANDRPRAAQDAARVADALRTRRAAEARQASRSQQWLAIAWTWDRDWRTRSVNRSATYGCYDGAWSDDSLEVCPGEWRVRTPALAGPVYAIDGQLTEPELHRRAEGAPAVHPEAEQFCLVREAQLGAQRVTVSCGGDGAAAFELWLPRELASPGGALAAVMVGDVVRIDGHQVLKREPAPDASPRGAERWTFEEVPPTGVSIADHTRCCALPGRASP